MFNQLQQGFRSGKIEQFSRSRIIKCSAFGIIVYGFAQCFKAGAYWDMEADGFNYELNFEWLNDKEPNSSDPRFEFMRSYSHTFSFITRLPSIILGSLLNKTFDFNSENWVIYRNFSIFIVLIIGLLSLLFYSTYETSNSQVSASILLLGFPALIGYGYFNAKDIPVFTATSLSLGLLRYCAFANRNIPRLSHLLSVFIVSFLITILSIGVRPTSYLVVFPAIVLIIYFSLAKQSPILLVPTISGFSLGLYLVYLTNATFQEDRFFWFYRTYKASSEFTMWKGGHNLSWGNIFLAGESEIYPFAVLASQIPDWVILVVFFSILNLLFRLVHRSLKGPKLNLSRIVDLYPVAYLFAICIYFLFATPILYDDIRQVMFLWAFILTLVLRMHFNLLNVLKQVQKVIYISFISLFIIITQINGVLLEQYAYSYKNLLARVSNPTGFESDYWAISSKEASNRILSDFYISKQTKVFAQPPGSFKIYLKDYVDINSSDNPELFVTISRPTGLPDNFKDCPIKEMIRQPQLFSSAVVMAYIRECPEPGR